MKVRLGNRMSAAPTLTPPSRLKIATSIGDIVHIGPSDAFIRQPC